MIARIRTIKPEFYKHGGLYDAEVESALPLRLAYTGLWCMADREGRFEWKPRELKLDVLPYDPVDFSRVLDALATRAWVVRYSSGGREFGWIVRFLTHQQINNRESQSTLPPPPDDLVKAVADGSYRYSGDAWTTRAARVKDARPTPHKGNRTEQNRTEHDGAPAPDASVVGDIPPTTAPGTWVQDAVALYGKHIGLIAHGRMGKALKPLVMQEGWPNVERWLEAYCKYAPLNRGPDKWDTSGNRDVRFCSPEKFVETYTEWRDLVDKPLDLGGHAGAA